MSRGSGPEYVRHMLVRPKRRGHNPSPVVTDHTWRYRDLLRSTWQSTVSTLGVWCLGTPDVSRFVSKENGSSFRSILRKHRDKKNSFLFPRWVYTFFSRQERVDYIPSLHQSPSVLRWRGPLTLRDRWDLSIRSCRISQVWSQLLPVLPTGINIDANKTKREFRRLFITFYRFDSFQFPPSCIEK